jgi:hypothetical protein
VELAREIERAHQQRPAERDVAAQLRQRGRRRAQQDASWWTAGRARPPDRDDVPLARGSASPGRPSRPIAIGGAAARAARRPVARGERDPQEGQRPRQIVEAGPIRAAEEARLDSSPKPWNTASASASSS